jgi:hypothetical protein
LQDRIFNNPKIFSEMFKGAIDHTVEQKVVIRKLDLACYSFLLSDKIEITNELCFTVVITTKICGTSEDQ